MSELRLIKGFDENKKVYEIFEGTDFDWAIRQGFEETEIEQAYNGCWYIVGYAPQKPAPTKEEVSEIRRQLYIEQVDPITAHINRLKDEEQTEEVITEIEALKLERSAIVEKIKSENPYPETVEVISELAGDDQNETISEENSANLDTKTTNLVV